MLGVEQAPNIYSHQGAAGGSRRKPRTIDIAAIESLDRGDCIERWRQMFGVAPPKYTSLEFMRKTLCYEAQVKAFGGPSNAVQRALKASLKGVRGDVEADSSADKNVDAYALTAAAAASASCVEPDGVIEGSASYAHQTSWHNNTAPDACDQTSITSRGHIKPNANMRTRGKAKRKLTELRDQIRNGQLHNVTQLLQAAIIGAGAIVVQLNADALANYLQTKKLNLESCTIDTAFQLRKRGSETKLIIGNKPMAERDQVLIDNIAKAHHYYDAIKSGLTFDQVAKTNNITKRRLLQIIDLTFLAPDFVKSILIGGQPDELTSKWLEKNPLPSN